MRPRYLFRSKVRASIRAALDALLKHGRPARVQLAVLVDRGLRELPIQPDYCGKRVNTVVDDHIIVKVNEYDGEDAVVLTNVKETAIRGS
jgi:pyrimidine operon attenuation protein/uracil phosphoribosyltransferase